MAKFAEEEVLSPALSVVNVIEIVGKLRENEHGII
jgi:hypothetical protein